MNTNPRIMQVEMPIKIYAYDIDLMGIVSNLVYVRWFEHLRSAFLDTYFPLEKMLNENSSPILAKTEIEYKYPLTIQENPIGTTWIINMKRSRWEMGFEISTADRIHCRGKQTGYYFNMETQKPAPMPDVLYNQFIKEKTLLETK